MRQNISKNTSTTELIELIKNDLIYIQCDFSKIIAASLVMETYFDLFFREDYYLINIHFYTDAWYHVQFNIEDITSEDDFVFTMKNLLREDFYNAFNVIPLIENADDVSDDDLLEKIKSGDGILFVPRDLTKHTLTVSEEYSGKYLCWPPGESTPLVDDELKILEDLFSKNNRFDLLLTIN